mmetsp:Transcript_28414/g.69260  ORF Transcript_28414/g.69260 Transcript_28414/m.69260 type:complete len:231 (+) Transcript_28414:1982-2674(+)
MDFPRHTLPSYHDKLCKQNPFVFCGAFSWEGIVREVLPLKVRLTRSGCQYRHPYLHQHRHFPPLLPISPFLPAEAVPPIPFSSALAAALPHYGLEFYCRLESPSYNPWVPLLYTSLGGHEKVGNRDAAYTVREKNSLRRESCSSSASYFSRPAQLRGRPHPGRRLRSYHAGGMLWLCRHTCIRCQDSRNGCTCCRPLCCPHIDIFLFGIGRMHTETSGDYSVSFWGRCRH